MTGLFLSMALASAMNKKEKLIRYIWFYLSFFIFGVAAIFYTLSTF